MAKKNDSPIEGNNQNVEIMDFTIQGAKASYDNKGAYVSVLKLMGMGVKLDVSFKKDAENHPYAWVESAKSKGFKYYLKKDSMEGMFNYLTAGIQTDFDPNPDEYETLPDDYNFEQDILKKIIESGQNIQFTPMFRETPGYISGCKSYRKGTIIFRLPYTQELIDYLREYKQFI